MEKNSKLLGIAIIDREIIWSLSTLWEGPVSPYSLDSIELGIRAFLTSPQLVASRIDGAWSNVVNPLLEDRCVEEPFNDSLLDYEFHPPIDPHPYMDLNESESSFLIKYLSEEISRQIGNILPKWIKRKGEAFAYIDAWYYGFPKNICEQHARRMEHWEDATEKVKNIDDVSDHVLLHSGPDEHAKYIVGCHRAGLLYYGSSPVAKLCAEHIFSKWPDYLFKTLGEDYKKACEELRGPGVGLALPPLTSLLLSRADRRVEIPSVLRGMRDEYNSSRNKLWTILKEMWNAKTFEKQIGILKELEAASKNIFKAAFPERFDALSIAISASDIASGNISTILSNIRSHNLPKAKVAGVSFAYKLTKDLNKHMLSNNEILHRHFTRSELREFGA